MATRAKPDNRYPGGKGQTGVWQWILGRMPHHVGYVEPFAGKASIARRKPPAFETVLVDRDEAVVRWLRKWRPSEAVVLHGCGLAWLEDHDAQLNGDWLVYCDPPYVLRTRTKKKLYRWELSDADHARLLAWAKRAQCLVMISGYDSPNYREALDGWQVYTRPVRTRGGTWRTGHLWCNFPPDVGGGGGVCYSKLGGDYRERERVARRVKRWTDNLRRMVPTEREAVLRALLAAARELGGTPER